MATYEDITIDQGTDVSMRLELVDKNNLAKDLTNYAVAAKIKKTYNSIDSDEIVTFSAQIPTPASDGIINLSLTNSQTDAMKIGRWVYDCEISYTDSDGDTIIERIIEGKATVTPSVTK